MINEYTILESIIDGNITITNTSGDFVVGFGYGNQADLLKYLKGKKGTKIYPLIWLESGFEAEGGNPFSESDMRFIFAINSKMSLLNRDRNQQSFVSNLDIVLDQFIKLMHAEKAEMIDEDENIIRRIFNYEQDSLHRATHVWDAITLDCKIRFNLNCK